MPSKLQFYTQMADTAARQVTGSFGEWTAFLETMGRLYKYPFHEQLMIFAQKPNATACADYDLWNKQMGRYVRRGSKGIALLDTTGDNPRLKYVFDVSDTGGRENSRRLNLWEYKDEHHDSVTADLEKRFGVSGEKGLADQLEQIASKLVTEYWNDNRRDILGILADSFLEEYDDYNVEVAFRNAATVSTTYALMSRCGLNPGDYFEHEDFLSVFDFNTRDTIAVLGSAVSNSSEQILRQTQAVHLWRVHNRYLVPRRHQCEHYRSVSPSVAPFHSQLFRRLRLLEREQVRIIICDIDALMSYAVGNCDKAFKIIPLLIILISRF